MTPADYVLSTFAAAGISQRAIARHVNGLPSTVNRWPERSDGRIPSRYHRDLLKLARLHNVAVTAENLVYGSEKKR